MRVVDDEPGSGGEGRIDDFSGLMLLAEQLFEVAETEVEVVAEQGLCLADAMGSCAEEGECDKEQGGSGPEAARHGGAYRQ